MIPEEGFFNVLGRQCLIKGKVFNCKLKTISNDEIVEGTVLFIENFPFHLGYEANKCKDSSCSCTCHIQIQEQAEGPFVCLFASSYLYHIFIIIIF